MSTYAEKLRAKNIQLSPYISPSKCLHMRGNKSMIRTVNHAKKVCRLCGKVFLARHETEEKKVDEVQEGETVVREEK